VDGLAVADKFDATIAGDHLIGDAHTPFAVTVDPDRELA
jgi:hypothetical protein